MIKGMVYHQRGLIVILIAALFSLAALQSLEFFLKYSSSSILGQTVSCRQRYYQCTSNTQCCSGFCNPNRKVCDLPSTLSASTSPTPVVSNKIPCEEVINLNKFFCLNTTVGKTSPLVTTNPLKPICDEVNRIQNVYCISTLIGTSLPYTTPKPTGIGTSNSLPKPTSIGSSGNFLLN